MKGGEIEMLNVFKSRFTKVTMLVFVLALSIMGQAFAAEAADTATVTAMTDAFGNVKATALAALAAIAAIAIVMFAGIYAWKYGKKVFSIIAK